MAGSEEYRTYAAKCEARSKREIDPEIKAEWETMAKRYRRLAKMADLNAQTDVVYEPGPINAGAGEPQAQQQPQGKLKPKE